MSRPVGGKNEAKTDIFVGNNNPQAGALTGALVAMGKIVKERPDATKKAKKVSAYDTSGEAVRDK